MNRKLKLQRILERLPSIPAMITGVMALYFMCGWRAEVEKSNALADTVLRLTSLPPQTIPARIFRHKSDRGEEITHLIIYRPGYAQVFEEVEILQPGSPVPDWAFAGPAEPPSDKKVGTAVPFAQSVEVVLNFNR